MIAVLSVCAAVVFVAAVVLVIWWRPWLRRGGRKDLP